MKGHALCTVGFPLPATTANGSFIMLLSWTIIASVWCGAPSNAQGALQEIAVPSDPVTILAHEQTLTFAEALLESDRVWLPADASEAVHGFELKAEGLCAGEICIPVPTDADWVRTDEGRTWLDVVGFAHYVDQPVVADSGRKVWSFGPVPVLHTSLAAGRAPDFALPDRAGKTVRLSDFRGRKVLLLSWASW